MIIRSNLGLTQIRSKMVSIADTKDLESLFFSQFGKIPEVISRAPGRINIIGEHIDYNDGFVLPVAIDKYITVCAARNNTPGHYRINAQDLNESVEWTVDKPLLSRPLWLNYIYGTLVEWQNSDLSTKGIDLWFSGDIPTGAGLSSSAALEASAAIAIAKLWGLEIAPRNLALHCQMVEHNYVGVKCGIMDQYASVFGARQKAILLDCLSVEHEYLPLHMEDHLFLLCNTGVTHSLASSGYNDRRASCEKAIEIIKKADDSIENWRDVNIPFLSKIRPQLSEKEYRRSLHVVREISRVQAAAEALRKNDLKALGALMYRSHEDLSQNYEVSCPELDFLVEEARKESSILGARMMGGGFGGCTINLIAREEVSAFLERVRLTYHDRFGIELQSYVVESGNGAGILET